MKRLIMMMAAAMAAIGAWADTETVGGYTWTYWINGGTAEIYEVSPSPTGAVTIPSTLGGKPVTSVGENAFFACRGLTSVTIPGSVTSIGRAAFEDCSGLTSVKIPNSVTSIGDSAFRDCSGLTSVTIPNSVTNVGDEAFYGCNSSLFDTVTVPGVKLVDGWAVGTIGSLSGDLDLTGIRGIGYAAFYYCRDLTSVTIPSSVTRIGEHAFDDCIGLKSVIIPNSVTSIGDWAFGGCRGLTSVTIPNSVTSIGNGVFSSCFGLTSVTIPDSVTSIGEEAFYSCDSLTNVTIPNSVTNVGKEAFGACDGLTSVTIPDSVTSIGEYAFHDTELVTVHVSKGDADRVKELINGSGYDVSGVAFVEDLKPTAYYTVTFNANGGNGGTTRMVAKDASVGVLPTVTRSGYTFDGWFTAAIGGKQVTSATKATGNVTYYAHWTAKSGGGSDGGVTPTPVQVVQYGGVVDAAFAGKQNVLGALYDAKGSLVGAVELKFGKKGKKGVKVSASATMIIGGKAKKVSAKAVTLPVDESGMVATRGQRPTATLPIAFKDPIGGMEFALNADGTFTLKNASYEMVGAVKSGASGLRTLPVGGAMPEKAMHFNVDIGAMPDFGAGLVLLDEVLPDNEPVQCLGMKWSCDKAAKLKYVKVKDGGQTRYELPIPEGNVAGLKLKYTAKTGQFKGSFNVYATTVGAKPKLKKYTVNVVGFVVDGVGVGQATMKKPAAGPWPVTVE